MADEIPLGVEVRDTVTGFVGRATARHEYINGCVRIELEALDKDGAPTAYVFDVQRLEVTATPTPEPRRSRTGGPTSSTPPARR